MNMEVVVIAAVSNNNVIGKDGKLPWHIPEDLKHFKNLTMGSPIIMGRKTFESIGKALPGRTNVVISRNKDFSADGVLVYNSFEEALEKCKDSKTIFIIGGYSLFRAGLEFADRIELTRVNQKVDGDVFFPKLEWNDWEETYRSDRKTHSFITYRRK